MFWHIVLLLLYPFTCPMRRPTADDRDREILALRQQLLILQRRVGRRPLLTRFEELVPFVVEGGDGRW